MRPLQSGGGGWGHWSPAPPCAHLPTVSSRFSVVPGSSHCGDLAGPPHAGLRQPPGPPPPLPTPRPSPPHPPHAAHHVPSTGTASGAPTVFVKFEPEPDKGKPGRRGSPGTTGFVQGDDPSPPALSQGKEGSVPLREAAAEERAAVHSLVLTLSRLQWGAHLLGPSGRGRVGRAPGSGATWASLGKSRNESKVVPGLTVSGHFGAVCPLWGDGDDQAPPSLQEAHRHPEKEARGGPGMSGALEPDPVTGRRGETAQEADAAHATC